MYVYTISENKHNNKRTTIAERIKKTQEKGKKWIVGKKGQRLLKRKRMRYNEYAKRPRVTNIVNIVYVTYIRTNKHTIIIKFKYTYIHNIYSI